MLNPSLVSFRFQAYGNTYAVDIQNDAVILLVDKSTGWQRVPELPFISATDADITKAGGPVKFTDLIVRAINAVLAVLWGGVKVPVADTPAPSTLSLREKVLAELRLNFRVHEKMDGSVELQRKIV